MPSASAVPVQALPAATARVSDDPGSHHPRDRAGLPGAQVPFACCVISGDIDPAAGFLEAFALFAMGKPEEALPRFLRAALNHPRAARMLVGDRTVRPQSPDEAEDHNTGVSLLRAVHAYLADQPRGAKRFFHSLVHDPRVAKLLDESVAVVIRWHEQHPTREREAFDRMQLMRSREFANAEARKLMDLVEGAGSRRRVGR